MANLILSRPQAQAHQALNVPPGSRLVLDFPADQATLERAGDNLVFSFEDGSRIELTNFYNEFSREDLPDFEVNGALVGGEKFFDAFAPDLLPTADTAQAARETHVVGLEEGLGADKLYGGAGDDTLIGSWKMDGLPSEDFTVKGNLLDGGSGNDILVRAMLEKQDATGENVNLSTGGTLTVRDNISQGGDGNDTLYGAQLSLLLRLHLLRDGG